MIESGESFACFRSRATAEACLLHPWIQLVTVAEPAEEPTVTLAKDNHSIQKTAWNNRDSNYYLFDYKSKTASQLYEMNLSLNPKKMVEVSSSCGEEGEEEEDQFSFFTADGLVRRDSELTVNSEGKITIKESCDTEGQLAQDNKNTAEEVQTKVTNNDDNNNNNSRDDNIEFVGLVVRPKTPLITSEDIQKQVAQISERKQSGCGSLPDVISSSVETPATELHMSRLETEILDMISLRTRSRLHLNLVARSQSDGNVFIHHILIIFIWTNVTSTRNTLALNQGSSLFFL